MPSVAIALSLASVFECAVEDLFGTSLSDADQATWAWPPASSQARFWVAEVGGRLWRFPVEPTEAGPVPHDGIWKGNVVLGGSMEHPSKTLVLACCDPAAGWLAREYTHRSGFRMIVLRRSSREALGLLRQGFVHAAGVHFATPDHPEENARIAQQMVGTGYDLLRGARWQAGVCFRAHRRITRLGDLSRQRLRWIGRDAGSAAQRCLDELLDRRVSPRRFARDHRGVAQAVRDGWADAGVCHRLVSEEAGLQFLGIRWEFFDWCFPEALRDDPRIGALIDTVRSSSYRRWLGDLPGYDTRLSGDIQMIATRLASGL